MEKQKINLKTFEKERLQTAQLLEAKGGSGITHSGVNTTYTGVMDSDCHSSDCDY
jgi:hypothetical protein